MGETVTVACKLPHGLRLQIQELRETLVPVMGGGMQKVEQWHKVGREVVLNGVASEFGKMPKGGPLSHGFALTPGVDKDFFDKWLEQNKDTPLVTEGLIFAHSQPASVVDQAADLAEVRSGLEPLDPEKLPIRGIETADEQSADTEPGKAVARRRRAAG